MKKIIILVIAALALSFTAQAQAQETMTIEPLFDVWLDEDDPTVNYRMHSNFVKESLYGNSRKTAIAFDTAPIFGRLVSSAKLRLCVDAQNEPSPTVYLHSCNDAFTEAANWSCAIDRDEDGNCYENNDLPWTGVHGQDTVLDEVTLDPNSEGEYFTFDVTDFVSANVGSIARFIITKMNDKLLDLYAEHEACPPQLLVEYSYKNVLCEGDFNGDGDVDGSDLAVFAADFGRTDCQSHEGMALIPSGCFEMGDTFSEGYTWELPVHNVCITSDFYMDIHEVTNAEYAACVSAGGCTAPGDSSSHTRGSYYGNLYYDDFPVIYVIWHQAYDYCAWAGKRLPTEAEWEYAARGGLSGKRYPWGDTISGTDVNYWESGDPWDDDTSPVETYAANGYGLYDMAGNVWEWVNDWFQSDYYSESPTNDPPGPASGSYRVLRGGCWNDDAGYLRVALRLDPAPTYQDYYLGFRCAGD